MIIIGGVHRLFTFSDHSAVMTAWKRKRFQLSDFVGKGDAIPAAFTRSRPKKARRRDIPEAAFSDDAHSIPVKAASTRRA
ncbi:hypothetical protein [Lysobacter sp. N42]|uniref:hypothetical protein n=1 Tax=Lysobacter sp. N42 TaxID=2545719 RepID=UPI0010485827|nr:hypothetical protein [Lysobacter sp. N42]TCZ86049.1 hypothetical protein EYQ95_18770 [Lysobacter sp. N42]